jgi:phage gp46-like protein
VQRWLALRYDSSPEADLTDAIDENGIESEILVALGTEARVAANEVPHGKVNRGYWADSLDGSGEQTGSRLWLLEDAPATPEKARDAEKYAAEALRFLTSSRRARTVRTRAELIDDVVWLHVAITLPSGIVRNFGPYRAP